MPLPELGLPLLPPLAPAPPDCAPEVLPLLPALPVLDPLALGSDDGELEEELVPLLPWLLSPLPPPLHAASDAESSNAGARTRYLFMSSLLG